MKDQKSLIKPLIAEKNARDQRIFTLMGKGRRGGGGENGG